MIGRRLVLMLVCGLAGLLPVASRGENFVVNVNDQNGFSPSQITIKVGDTVTFEKAATSFPHNFRSDAFDGQCAFGPTCFRCGVGSACQGQGGSGATTTEAFTVTLSFFDQPGTFPYFCDPHGAPGGVGMAGRIIVEEDDSPPPPPPPTNTAGKIRFTSASYNRAEASGNAAIQVERANGDDGAVGVSFGTSNGTAVAGQDYSAANGTLSWADGEDGVKTFNVAITSDSTDENNETVNLQLTSPTGGAALGSPASSTLTITDDDGGEATGTVELTSASFNAAETAPQATVTVKRTGGSQGAASVEYDTSNGSATAGQDYTQIGGTLNWANGDVAEKSFQVPILDDTSTEGSETISVTLSQPVGVAMGSPAAATVTLFDDESAPPCVDGEHQVCLLGRFLATIHWVRPNQQAGEGRVTKLTDSAAAFEFFEPGNVEVVLKIKDACGLPQGNPLRSYWPFVAGLTNVRVELTIIDTESGAVRRFYNALDQSFFTPALDSPDGKTNPPGAIQATLEALGAFATCDG